MGQVPASLSAFCGRSGRRNERPSIALRAAQVDGAGPVPALGAAQARRQLGEPEIAVGSHDGGGVQVGAVLAVGAPGRHLVAAQLGQALDDKGHVKRTNWELSTLSPHAPEWGTTAGLLG